MKYLMQRHRNLLALYLCLTMTAASAGHDNLGYWRHPCSPDGVCTPSRDTYGHYQPKWRRWPGVTDLDYESTTTSGEPAAPPPTPRTTPRISPEQMLPSPGETPRINERQPPAPFETSPQLDNPPAPPTKAGKEPTTTPEKEPEPDILSPPGEDILDELLNEPTKRPEPATGPEKEPSTDVNPETAPDSDKPYEGDPFKDDPIFEDKAPAPPGGLKRKDADVEPDVKSSLRPAPMRLPAAQQTQNLPQSRLTRSAKSAEPRLIPANQSTGKSAAKRMPREGMSHQMTPRNPLRGEPGPEMVVADEEIVPTAAWQAPQPAAEPRVATGPRANPLRAQ